MVTDFVNRTIDVGGDLVNFERTSRELRLSAENRLDAVNLTFEPSIDEPGWVDVSISVQFPDTPSGDQVEVYGIVSLDKQALEVLKDYFNDMA